MKKFYVFTGLGILSAIATPAMANNHCVKPINNYHIIKPHAVNKVSVLAGAKRKIIHCRKHKVRNSSSVDKFGQKYTLENGVRVYRVLPSINARSNKMAHKRARVIYGMKVNRHKRAAKLRRQKILASRQAAFERGFDKGYEKAKSEYANKSKRRNRYGYGRRYSTSFYGYPYSRRFHFTPYGTGRYNSFRP